MNVPRALLAAALTALLAALPRVSSADVPGPRPVCDAEGRGCSSCWQHASGDEKDAARFDECSTLLKAKGLVEACRHQQGAGETVYFCPAGAKVETKIVGGGGCAGCALGEGSGATALASLALAAAIAATRRRRARRDAR